MEFNDLKVGMELYRYEYEYGNSQLGIIGYEISEVVKVFKRSVRLRYKGKNINYVSEWNEKEFKALKYEIYTDDMLEDILFKVAKAELKKEYYQTDNKNIPKITSKQILVGILNSVYEDTNKLDYKTKENNK